MEEDDEVVGEAMDCCGSSAVAVLPIFSRKGDPLDNSADARSGIVVEDRAEIRSEADDEVIAIDNAENRGGKPLPTPDSPDLLLDKDRVNSAGGDGGTPV
jgi:hypothetical protein